MGAGPQSTDNRSNRDENDGRAMSSLFDRIATEIAEHSSAADATTETPRVSVDRVSVDRASDDSGPGGIVIDGTGNWPAPDISTQIDRPRLANRQCSRTGCSDAAAVTLSYHYGKSQVWIDQLSPEREPHMYDMCAYHAAGLSVPRGWHLDDRRQLRHGGLIAV